MCNGRHMETFAIFQILYKTPISANILGQIITSHGKLWKYFRMSSTAYKKCVWKVILINLLHGCVETVLRSSRKKHEGCSHLVVAPFPCGSFQYVYTASSQSNLNPLLRAVAIKLWLSAEIPCKHLSPPWDAALQGSRFKSQGCHRCCVSMAASQVAKMQVCGWESGRS